MKPEQLGVCESLGHALYPSHLEVSTCINWRPVEVSALRKLVCPVCNNWFKDPDPTIEFQGGIFCPECRREGRKLVGVIHPESIAPVPPTEPSPTLSELKARLTGIKEFRHKWRRLNDEEFKVWMEQYITDLDLQIEAAAKEARHE